MTKLQLIIFSILTAIVAADRTASTAKGGRKLRRSVDETEETVGNKDIIENKENDAKNSSRMLGGYRYYHHYYHKKHDDDDGRLSLAVRSTKP